MTQPTTLPPIVDGLAVVLPLPDPHGANQSSSKGELDVVSFSGADGFRPEVMQNSAKRQLQVDSNTLGASLDNNSPTITGDSRGDHVSGHLTSNERRI